MRNACTPLNIQTKTKPPKGAAILVVEDDENMAVVLQARLESFGYSVCAVAKSAAETLLCARNHRPDLILMDIMLEGDTNGIQAAEHILGQQDVPIIFLSCRSDQEVIDSAILTRPFAYLVKPYHNAELRSTIEIALIRHRAAKEREQLIFRLEKALQEIKKLSGLLPICASCKRIRDEADRWLPFAAYIRSHSEADFSYGICPDCAPRLYPDVFSNESNK